MVLKGQQIVSGTTTSSNDIRIGQFNTQQNLAANYEIRFNNTEWKIVIVNWTVSARNDYTAFTNLDAWLDSKVYIISQNPIGSALLGEGRITWSAFERGFTKTWRGQRNVSATVPPEKVFLRFSQTYNLALPPFTEQRCIINNSYYVVFEALVDSPATIPVVTASTTTDTDTSEPAPGGWELPSFFGGLGTGVIIGGAAILLVLLYLKR